MDGLLQRGGVLSVRSRPASVAVQRLRLDLAHGEASRGLHPPMGLVVASSAIVPFERSAPAPRILHRQPCPRSEVM
jgi:hypothetical protein